MWPFSFHFFNMESICIPNIYIIAEVVHQIESDSLEFEAHFYI